MEEMLAQIETISQIELRLESWTEHYPTGIVFNQYGQAVFSDYADSIEEYKHVIDACKSKFKFNTEVVAVIDPRDIDDSNVLDVVKELYAYIQDIIKSL